MLNYKLDEIPPPPQNPPSPDWKEPENPEQEKPEETPKPQ